ncbi:MAG: GreA/GreB family elongation factor [Patescibacteria group bacterium]|nr:GreA/GreB family elongation factor [Patescibacteria group bacterium]
MPRRNPPAEPEPVYLTATGIARLKAKLARLKQELPELAAEAGHAASFGDRSENDAYKQAKGILRRTQRQIWTIEAQLKNAVEIKIGQKGKSDKQIVELGSTVTIKSGNGARRTYQILGTLETNPSEGIISHKSPLGAALVGKKEGDIAEIKTARGKQEWKITKIN